MNPIRTMLTNQVYKLPGGTDENDLPVEVTEDGCVISVWEFTAQERSAIAGGAVLQLTLVTTGHPPVRLEVL